MIELTTRLPKHGFLRRYGLLLGIFALGLLVGAAYYAWPRSQQWVTKRGPDPDLTVVEFAPGILIRKPAGAPSVATGALDPHGKAITASCSACHTTKPPNTELKLGIEPKSFHQGLKGVHGNLT